MNKLSAIIEAPVLAALLILAGCNGAEEVTQAESAIAIRAQAVKAVDRAIVATYTGSLEGEQQAVLYAKIAEAVETVRVSQGDRVTANSVLVSLDPTGPSTGYREARSRFQNAEKNYTKMQYLFKEGAVAETEFDAAETEYEVARANFEAVQRLVDVQTPIGGVVTSVNVSAGDFVTVGQHLATVATIDKLRVKFGVNADEIGMITKGTTVKVTSDAVADTALGTITRVSSSADPTTRTFQVEAMIDNTDRTFRPGMFVRILYVRQALDSVLAVPAKAVLVLDGQPTVFTVKGDRAYRREVQLGVDLIGERIVTGGLAAGDTVVTLGQDYLRDSTLVDITEFNGMQP